jgi:glycosyltransferase involved in cell wall biosynthesis
VLAITPRVDPDDDLLGFIHVWLSRLAARVERLYVVQLWAAPSHLPANTVVYSLGKDGGVGKPGQLARFVRLVGRLCLNRRVDAVLCHMGPIFAVCAAPFARAAGLPLVLWYAHGAVSPTLRLAHALVDRVGTSGPTGFRIPSQKVRFTGQGIETDRFLPPSLEPPAGPLVSVGRLSPIKDYATLLRALTRLADRGHRPRLEVVGGTHLPAEERYRDELIEQTAALGLADRVVFRPGLPHRWVAPVYQQASLFASASRTGSLDKAMLEALSCARLAVTCNDAFGDFFGPEADRYTYPAGDDAILAERLETLLLLSPAERRARGLALRERVVAEHSVEHLADELVRLLDRRSWPATLGAVAPG